MSLILLPAELILYIASFLVYPDIVKLAKVCHRTCVILSPLRENLPWKITAARRSNGHFVVDIKVGWFNPAYELPRIRLLWKGESRKKQHKLEITTLKGIGGPLLIKILSSKDPYVEINADGAVIDVHSQPTKGSYPTILRIGYLHPRYCSETSLVSLIMNDLPIRDQETSILSSLMK